MEEDGVRPGSDRSCALHPGPSRSSGHMSHKWWGNFSQIGRLLVETSFSNPTRWEKVTQPQFTCWDEEWLPLAKEKLFSSPETSLCVSELRVVERKLFWSHLPKFTFQTWLGAGVLLLELTAQPLVIPRAGPATGRVSRGCPEDCSGSDLLDQSCYGLPAPSGQPSGLPRPEVAR